MSYPINIMITVNGPEATAGTWKPDMDAITSYTPTRYWARCMERGTKNDRDHFHMVICQQRATKKRLKTWNNFIRGLFPDNAIDIQALKGTVTQAREYIFKTETKLDILPKPQENGIIPKNGRPGKAIDAEAIKEAIIEGGIKQVAEEHTEAFLKHGSNIRALADIIDNKAPERNRMDVSIYFGAAGVGKSAYSKYIAELVGGDDVYHYTKVGGSAGTFWFDKYNGEKVLIIDDFTGTTMPHGAMLKILGTDPFRVECKGGSAWAAWTTVIITSNLSPWSWYSGYWAKNGNVTRDAFFRRINRILFCKSMTSKGAAGLTMQAKVLKDTKPFQRSATFVPEVEYDDTITETAATFKQQAVTNGLPPVQVYRNGEYRSTTPEDPRPSRQNTVIGLAGPGGGFYGQCTY